MKFYRFLLENHVLANLSFFLVIITGIMAYNNLPIAREPDINFNWINILTPLPGASSLEVEKRVTDPLENSIRQGVKDLKVVSSTSRDGISLIMVRFKNLNKSDFEKRLADVRREVLSAYTDKLPPEAQDPQIVELTTSSGFPTAMIAISTDVFDENFRRYISRVKKEFERITGVDDVQLLGMEKPELHIAFYPERLEGLGLSPSDIAQTVSLYFKDKTIGDIETLDGRWIIRLKGTSSTLEELEKFPVISASGVVTLGSLARIFRSTSEPSSLVRYKNKPAIMISVVKQEGINTLELLKRINQGVYEQNSTVNSHGYHLALIDDQTVSTRDAIQLMQKNAVLGLLLVMLVTFIFMGFSSALIVSIGIFFTLSAVFILLYVTGGTLTNSILLGLVIALGMLVDDAVVVIEAIYYRLQRGIIPLTSILDALKEVSAPVLTSVLTTCAVFLPLILLPGIVGDFLRAVPLIVCISLLISLLEAFWMLPSHALSFNFNIFNGFSGSTWREKANRRLRINYSLVLIYFFRNPRKSILGVFFIFLCASVLIVSGVVEFRFFAADPLRLVYINVELPSRKVLSDSLAISEKVEKLALAALRPGELQASIVYSGQNFDMTGISYGDNLGQVFISLNPIKDDMRDTYEVISSIEKQVGSQLENSKIEVKVFEDGPPVGQPINAKVLGTKFEDIQLVVNKLITFMKSHGAFYNVNTDFKPGSPELYLSLDGDAIQRSGLSPSRVTEALQGYVDGILIGQYQYLGDEVDVKLFSNKLISNLDDLFAQTLPSKSGEPIALGELVDAEYGFSYQDIRHYNFLRSITISSDIKNQQINTIVANKLFDDYWKSIKHLHPEVKIDYSGALDDVNESLSGIGILFVVGIGLVYLILGTQFKSYIQPFIVLAAVPLAFTGVIFGLAITGNPISLNTLYGTVALSGVAVNSSIVLVAAANARINAGISPIHATIFACRRRVIPIIITSTTTIAGLFSLAAGFGGKSLVWGGVATAIVGGLTFSTLLVLIIVPILYHKCTTLMKNA